MTSVDVGVLRSSGSPKLGLMTDMSTHTHKLNASVLNTGCVCVRVDNVELDDDDLAGEGKMETCAHSLLSVISAQS